MIEKQGVTLNPMGDHIIVIPIPESETTPSGLYIPETIHKMVRKALVVGVGPGLYDGKGHRVPLGLMVDDVVLIGGWAGTEIKVDGQTILIIRIDDVAAIVLPDEDNENSEDKSTVNIDTSVQTEVAVE